MPNSGQEASTARTDGHARNDRHRLVSVGSNSGPDLSIEDGFVSPGEGDPVQVVADRTELLGRLFSIVEKAPYWSDNGSSAIDDPDHLRGGPLATATGYNHSVQEAFARNIRIRSFTELKRATGNPIDWFDIDVESDIAWCWEFSAFIGKRTPLKYLQMHGIRRFVVAPGGYHHKIASLFPGGLLPKGCREPRFSQSFEDYCGDLYHHAKQGFLVPGENEASVPSAVVQGPFVQHFEGPAIQPYGVWHLVPVRGCEYRELAPLTYERILSHSRQHEPMFQADLMLEDRDIEESEYNDPPRFEPRLYLMLMTGFRKILELGRWIEGSPKNPLPSDYRLAISRWIQTMNLTGGVADHLYTRDAMRPTISFEAYLQECAFPAFLDLLEKSVAGISEHRKQKLLEQGVVSRLDLSLAYMHDNSLAHLEGFGPEMASRMKGLVVTPEQLQSMATEQRRLEADPYVQAIY